MALVLIKETGDGLPNANSYANVADGDAYFEGHLYASAWTAATTANKEKALVFATRLIDSQYQFGGIKNELRAILALAPCRLSRCGLGGRACRK